MMQCRVNFLDDTYLIWELERDALGQNLFSKVCEDLDLLERDFYGLSMWDSTNTRVWLDCSKILGKQVKGPVAEFFFNFKFYPPDPSVLAEDITRYHLCLQLRKDIMNGRLPCPSDMLALLGSYTVQSTLGDYDPNLHKNNYVSEIVLAPNQSEDLEKKVMELHATHRSMSPAQADILFLEHAKTLPMYGVDLHPAKDGSGADVMLGLYSEGLMVYEDEIKINSFFWPRVLKISHKRNTFLLKMRPSEDESVGDVCFTLPSYKACKQLWKCAVENHGFFRSRLHDTKTRRFLTIGSKFRFKGRTLSECVEASANITRAPPQFLRLSTKRKENEEILKVLKQPARTEMDDWFLAHDSDKWDVSASDNIMLESKDLWESKQQTDDWFVLLESSLSSEPGFQKPWETEEQREVQIVKESESEEMITDELVIKRSYTVNVAQEGPMELKVIEELARDIMEKEHPEIKEQIMGAMKESLTEEILQVNGERIQKVIITKQWTQEVNSFVESQEDIEKKTVVVTEEGVLLRGSGDTSERLEIMEQRLREVEAIEQKLQDVEMLRVGLLEIESLAQRLQEAERERIQQAETVDWYILLDRNPALLTAAPTAEEELQIDLLKLMERNDDWYILLEMPSQTMQFSTSSTVPLVYPQLQSTIIDPYEQSTVTTKKVEYTQQMLMTVEEKRPQQVTFEQRAIQILREVEDDWAFVLDVPPKEAVPLVYPHLKGTTAKLYEESKEDIVTEVMTESAGQKQRTEQKSAVLPLTFPVVPREIDDDWFHLFDRVPHEQRSILPVVPLVYPHLKGTTAKPYEESKEDIVTEMITESAGQKLRTEQKSAVLPLTFPVVPREIDDDWFQLFDRVPHEQRSILPVPLVYPHLRGTTAKLYEESKEDIVTEVMTESAGQKQRTEQKSSVLPLTFPVVPREIDDDWFQLFDRVPHEQRSILPGSRFVSLSPHDEEKRAIERRRDEEQNKRHEMRMQEKRPEPVLLEHRPSQEQRERDDDWFIMFDVSPKTSVPTILEVFEESRENRMRREERTEVMTVIAGQTPITEKKMMMVVQMPQEFPVVPREIDDDWFQMFDPVPYEKRISSPDVKSRVVLAHEPTKDHIVERNIITKVRQVVFEEHRESFKIVPHIFPVGVRDVEDDWFELLDPTPFEKRVVPSDDFEKHRMREEEDRRARQQDRRMREDMESRVRQQEIRKQELEVRRSHPAVIVQTVAQSQREVEDDWFVVFDVSPKQTVVADVIKLDKKGEELRRKEEERRREEERINAAKMRREDERRRQKRVEDMLKISGGPEKRPVWKQREREDDWFALMGVSSKDSVATMIPVLSPMVAPKSHSLIPAEQPLTSTPTIQPVSVTKTIYRDKTIDSLDITLESELEDSLLMRKSRRWTKRIEGESIYVRHSILMLEDSDVTQELVLRHHASVRELKRVFMEGMQDFGPTEWDRRLSSYSPMPKPQLPHANTDILIGMGLIEDGGSYTHMNQYLLYQTA